MGPLIEHRRPRQSTVATTVIDVPNRRPVHCFIAHRSRRRCGEFPRICCGLFWTARASDVGDRRLTPIRPPMYDATNREDAAYNDDRTSERRLANIQVVHERLAVMCRCRTRHKRRQRQELRWQIPTTSSVTGFTGDDGQPGQSLRPLPERSTRSRATTEAATTPFWMCPICNASHPNT